MHLLVSGATRTVSNCVGDPHLGVLVTPRAKNIRFAVDHGLVWGCDNDCFLAWNPKRYKRMVEQVRGLPGLKFVTAPDVVADHRRTLRRWKQWYPYLAKMGVPCAFVLQDGATVDTIPWDHITTVFIGGSTEWKLGPEAARLIREAKARDKWVHVGRVNSRKRERHFEELEADSFDGGQYSRFPDTYIPPALRRLAAPQQLSFPLTY